MHGKLGRLVIALAALSVVVAAPTAGTAATADAARSSFSGTCIEGSSSLPCSASAGQRYGSTTLEANGNDTEAAVEAVLGDVVGPGTDVAVLARGVTEDSADFDFTPSKVTSGHVFEWSYSGDAQNLAYLTVKAANGFAIIGVAGVTSGTVDVTGLLGGHEISHVSAWATNTSHTTPVTAQKLHGKDFLGNSRLAKIERGTVPCLHSETAELERCQFSRKSGSWLESKKGRFATSGQPISMDGKPGGEYVVAATVGLDGAVPCLAPSGNDMAGTSAGSELAGACVVEQMLSPHNATGMKVENFTTREVCTSSYPHPDRWDWQEVRTYPYTNSSGETETVYCYQGLGAALNDRNGTERDENNVYLAGAARCHVVWSSGAEVPAAKRPATRPWPAPGTVIVNSPIVWRPTSTMALAN